MKNLNTDVVVIGGGAIGTSIAYYLAQRNVEVLLLDQADLASGSSGACDGMIFLQSKKPGIHLRMAMASRSLFAQLDEQLPLPIEYGDCGGIVVIETADERQAMQQYVKEQQGIGLDVHLLDAAAARDMEPALSPDIAGAAFSPLDGQVNPIALTQAFGLGALRLGARVMTGTTVTGIVTQGSRVTGVQTDRGLFSAGAIVNAAGTGAPAIGDLVGLHIPIRPRRGQILVTQSMPPLISRCIISASYISAKYDPTMVRTGDGGISIEQTRSGNLLLGSTREFAGHDRRTTIDGLGRIAAKTCKVLPALANVNVIRSFAGLRPFTPDGLPILGPVDALDGFFMAAGHEGDGIALSPITGLLMAQQIVEGRTALPLTPFRLNRFDITNHRRAADAVPSS